MIDQDQKINSFVKKATEKLIPFELSGKEHEIAHDFVLTHVWKFIREFGDSGIKYDFEVVFYLVHQAILHLLFFNIFDKPHFFYKIPFFVDLHYPYIGKWGHENLASIGRPYRKRFGDSLFPKFTRPQISIKTEFLLTPEVLANLIVPYVKAIADIQTIFDNLKKQKKYPSEIVIRFITQQSPINVGLAGAGETINALKEDVIPWRKENAKRIAEIKTRDLEADIKRKEAETLEIRARVKKDKAECEKIKAEAAKARAEAERILLENERSKFELNKARLDLAFELVEKMYPGLDDSQRVNQVQKLVPALVTLTTIELDVSVIE